jgi:hypothetical protein
VATSGSLSGTTTTTTTTTTAAAVVTVMMGLAMVVMYDGDDHGNRI